MDLVDNTALREAFLASGMSKNAVARRAGMDDSQSSRALGVLPLRDKRRPGVVYYNKRCTYETAVKLAAAIGVDPVDVDL